MVIPVLANYVNGQWVTPDAAESLEVRNPATAQWERALRILGLLV